MGAEIVLHHFGDAAGAAETSRSVAGAPVFEADFTRPCAAAGAGGRRSCPECGAIDIVIANAAIERRIGWTAASDAARRRACLGKSPVADRALPDPRPADAERGWGRVVAIGSVMAERPRAEALAYAAVKAAQLVALRAIARDVARTRGDDERRLARRDRDREERRALCRRLVPRMLSWPRSPQAGPASLEDVAGAVLFLCSDAAAYITGADIPVDGGWTIGDAPGVLPGKRCPERRPARGEDGSVETTVERRQKTKPIKQGGLMKTITTLLATSCVAIALATPALAAELRFTIWTGNEAHLKMLNGYAERFKATHPDMTVKFEDDPARRLHAEAHIPARRRQRAGRAAG